MAFQESPEMEHLIEMREKDPKQYAGISAATKMRLGYYLKRKAAETDPDEAA